MAELREGSGKHDQVELVRGGAVTKDLEGEALMFEPFK